MFDREGFARLPDEIAIRLLGQAIAQVGDEGPVELGKLESLFDSLSSAARRRRVSPQPCRRPGQRPAGANL